MKIVMVGFCQVHGIVDALAHMIEGAEVRAIEARAMEHIGGVESALAILDAADIVFSHGLGDDAGEFSHTALVNSGRPVQLIPGFSFTGYHPDCIYIRGPHGDYESPAGWYHSAIVAAAYSMGLPCDAAKGLFNSFFFRKLGYYDEFQKACTFMRHQMVACGYDIEPELPRWLARGPFMHTINHPRVCVLASLARIGAIKAGLVPETTATPELFYDFLSLSPIWPVYPELAQALGVSGSYMFKRHGNCRVDGAPSIFIHRDQFIEESYALYADFPREAFEPLAQVASVLGSNLAGCGPQDSPHS